MTKPDEMRVHDAVHVREFQRARHVRGDPDWCRRRAFGVRVHPLDAGCTAHRDAGNDGVVHRKDATRFAKRVMKSVAKAINDAAVACSGGVAASRLFQLLLRAADTLLRHFSFSFNYLLRAAESLRRHCGLFNCCCEQQRRCSVTLSNYCREQLRRCGVTLFNCCCEQQGRCGVTWF